VKDYTLDWLIFYKHHAKHPVRDSATLYHSAPILQVFFNRSRGVEGHIFPGE
jgi:hypothetical protein